MRGLRDDIRHALRVFRTAPSFAAAAVLTLALGIGVNIAVFTVSHVALRARLPVAHARELATVYSWSPKGGDHFDFSYPLYVDLRDSREMDALAAYTSLGFGVAAGGHSERLVGELVTANYFQVLGIELTHGPGFSGEDERRGAAPVVVISSRLWRSMFDGEASAIGRPLDVNGVAATVVGIAPASFTGFTRGQRADVWLTVNQWFRLRHSPEDRLDSRQSSWLSLVGRVPSGRPLARAHERMTARMRAVETADAANWSVRSRPALEGDTSLVEDLGRPLDLLMLVVGLIMVIAAANVANLFLTRAYTRQQEIALRTALGATRWRVARQLLVEGAVLAFAGGTLGLLLGVWTASAIDIRTSAGGGLLSLAMEPDLTIVLFAAGVSAVAALAIGLVPAWTASKADLVAALKGAGEAIAGTVGKRRARTALTAVQVALSLVLVIGAGLFLRSLVKLRAIEPSLLTDRVVAATLNLTLRGYDPSRGSQFYARLLESVAALPGVQSATLTSVLPVTAGGARMNLNAGATEPKVDVPVEFEIVTVSPGYFETFGVPLVAGRDFPARPGAAPLAIVNESMKRTFWPGSDPVGRTFGIGGPAPYTIVGVARDTKYRSLREKPKMTLYLPLAQDYTAAANLAVRTALPPAQIVESLRGTVRELDAAMPLYNVRTMAEHVDRSLYLDRLRATLVGSLAALALALAAIGIYAVLSYAIAERTREVGVRLALGAEPSAVLRMLVASGARMAAAGVSAGLLLSAALARVVAGQLYGLSPLDPLTIALASGLLFAVALAAAFVPAWRATRIDPVAALRQR